ncbi:MAG: hypothetical protein IPJ28_01295 [Betaproteobacteria bacterium]|nr:hypothetical protein [Betaproteobacteria bacterium]
MIVDYELTTGLRSISQFNCEHIIAGLKIAFHVNLSNTRNVVWLVRMEYIQEEILQQLARNWGEHHKNVAPSIPYQRRINSSAIPVCRL